MVYTHLCKCVGGKKTKRSDLDAKDGGESFLNNNVCVAYLALSSVYYCISQLTVKSGFSFRRFQSRFTIKTFKTFTVVRSRSYYPGLGESRMESW